MSDEREFHPFVIAAATNPRAAWAAVTALETVGKQALADFLRAEIVAAGGRVPQGTELFPDTPAPLS